MQWDTHPINNPDGAMEKYFEHGSKVIVRYLNPLGGFERGLIGRVVEDDPQQTLVYVSARSGYSQPDGIGSEDLQKNYSINEFKERTWNRHSVLRIMYPDTPYSIWVMWDAITNAFERWYINIEMAFVRTEIGFDTMDYELDIVVSPDFSWEWKDEDRLGELVNKGVFTETQASEFYDYGFDALKRLESRVAPFNEQWKNWKPDPGWGPIQMPNNRSGWLG